MATLKIYSDIASQEEKIWYQWYGLDAVCYQDIDKFFEAMPEDDNEIDIRLYCNGGSCMEGWAIYDRLRQSGKDISVTVEGKAASMATVIMLAAEKKKRKCFANASFLVHNPWCDAGYLGRATADDLQRAADNLREEQEKIRDLYVERCGCGKKEIQDLMNEDKWIYPERAKELGLVGKVLMPISASASAYRSKEEFFNFNNKTMGNQTQTTEQKAQVSQSWLDKVLKFFGKNTPEEVTFDITLTAADGRQFDVERDEGKPQVGDKATPDGSYLMPEGETIVIDGGKITEIRPAEDSNAAAGAADGNGKESAEMLVQRVAELESSVAALETERDTLKAKLEEAKKNARTEEEQRIVDAVRKAGGVEALEQWSSTYKPAQRTPKTNRADEEALSREEGKNAIMERMKAFDKKK